MGCPHRCLYCNQVTVTGKEKGDLSPPALAARVKSALREARFPPPPGAEVAFYGGTFTALSREQMKALLEAVRPFLGKGGYEAVRISTRPDSVDPPCLDLLWEGGVRTVELGAQSMDDKVLRLSGRGHTARHTDEAASLLKALGFSLGIQLMLGLPGDTPQRFRETVRRIVELAPRYVRLYPTLVLAGTPLAQLYHAGRYRPLDLEQAIGLSAEACRILGEAGTTVIRMGLPASPELEGPGGVLAGPWHPAFGFLVQAAMVRERLREGLRKFRGASRIVIGCAPSEVPLIRGHRNEGIRWIQEFTGAGLVDVQPDPALSKGSLKVGGS